MSSTLEDISFLVRSEHRVAALVALSAQPRSRSELDELTGASSSTIRRTLRDFEERHWIERNSYHYETTELGSFIAEAVSDLLDRFRTEQQLRRVWEWLPEGMGGFSIEMCLDARVTVATAEDPYQPAGRLDELLADSETIQFVGFDVAMLEPIRATLCDRIVNGMRADLVVRPRVIRYIRSTHADAFHDPLESGNLTVKVHEDLPGCGVGFVEERAVIACYDPAGLSVRALIDTGGEECLEWAESVYGRYERQTPTVPI